ncbi:sugar transferase [Patulibacter minatonensis]|uniref:sugar transferase n=1 Tax=Patulibacter minatonensis TaxID=298163 RepID=UPI0006875B93|nr:sugar transferase [Patulibacter minatonensis]
MSSRSTQTAIADAPDPGPPPVADDWSPRSWRTPITRLLTDFVVVIVAVALASAARNRAPTWYDAVFAVSLVTVMALRGGYARPIEDSIVRVLVKHELASAAIASSITVTARAVLVDETTSFGGLLVTFAVGIIALALSRFFTTLYDRRRNQSEKGGFRALIVGSGELATETAERLERRPHIGLLPIGCLDDVATGAPRGAAADGLPVLGGLRDVEEVARLNRVDAVIISDMHSDDGDARLAELVAKAHELQLTVFVVPRFPESVNARTRRHRLGAFPVDELRPVDPRAPAFRLKYAIDRAIGITIVLGLAPMMLLLALGVRLSGPGPILYRQRRVGLDGHEFDILKFRSMREATPEELAWKPEEGSAPGGVEGVDRRTPFGKFLRSSNLDELPQLISIARGDMCIVGPRPERPEFVERFSQELKTYDARHRVKAGLTGWSQVHGLRGQTSIAERAAWDNYYIENWSFALDVSIVLRTFKTFSEPNE